MVLGSHDRSELQKATYALEKWADQNELEINMQKTEHMIFRKGGKISQEDKIFLKQEPLQTVNQVKYLGLTLQTTTNSFRIHTKQRATAATKAIHDIRELIKLSLKTAMIIFDTKIVPILTYGLDLTWDKLRTKDLHTLETVKARFLKATLGISKHTLSRLVYVLAQETFLIEELRTKLDLPSTSNWKKALDERIRKREDIWEDFYITEVMINRTWTDTNQKLRHFVTSLAVHGYHHKICRNQSLHEPHDNCSAVKNLKVRIYKTVILPVVLYGCETWTLTLTEEQRLRVFENKVLREIFGAKRDEVTGEWRKLHNTELHALYSSLDIRNIKSRRLRWAGNVARMSKSRNAYRVLVGRPKRPLGRPRHRWEDNIKMDLREVGYDDRDWINLAQDRDQWRAICK
ncbi:hypothetical protein ANN_16941 [Periplaneta americana]|uniref:Reverse transcriptase domain-containing protein n=1 Tax=Periplaneta americana TaxID=6978 RepID=A0ABQ8SRI2_PERAM|nr:hypothetical protein ANN_16941 [Periplaneta americana]